MLQNLRMHPYSIVAHSYAQIRVPECNFAFNVTGIRVLIGVTHGFAHDSINLITDEWR